MRTPPVGRAGYGSLDAARSLPISSRATESPKAHGAAKFFPVLASVFAALPRPLYRRFAYESSKAIDLIVTNVPGIPMTRFVAGAAIEAAYPFAPVAPRCPISIALYGYRDRLYVGLDADASAVPDLEEFRTLLTRSFEELAVA